MFGVSNLSLFLLATLVLLIYPLRVLLMEKVIKPVQAIHEELSNEEAPKAKKRRKGKKAKRACNQTRKQEGAKANVRVLRPDDDDESDELAGENVEQPADNTEGHLTNKENDVKEVESTTDSDGNRPYSPVPIDETEEGEKAVEEIVLVPLPVKMFDAMVQTEEKDISAAMTDLLDRILSSDELTAERADSLRDAFRQGFASKFGPDKAEAALSAECSKLRAQMDTMKANMNVAVAVVQRAKQMQDYFRSIEQRYVQNVERLQDRLHKLNMSKASLQQELTKKSNEIERLKQLDAQSRQALQAAKTRTAAISSASVNDLEFYKSECSRLKAEYTSANDLMRAQDLEIQQLRSLANTNKARIDELTNENNALKEQKVIATPQQKQVVQLELTRESSELPSNGQTENENRGAGEQSSGAPVTVAESEPEREQDAAAAATGADSTGAPEQAAGCTA